MLSAVLRDIYKLGHKNRARNLDGYFMNSIDIEGVRSEAVSTAQALIQHSLPFLQGVRKLASLRFKIPGEEGNPDFLVFTGIASEADHIPEEAARHLCSPLWLAQCDGEVKALEAHYEEHALAACKRIIEHHSRVA